jgi:sec-independent protein translocase protein TatA
MQLYAAIFGLGPLELVIIIAIIVILFLPALLPKLARRVGETVTTLKDMAGKSLDEDGDGANASGKAADSPGEADDSSKDLPKGPPDNGGGSRDAEDKT